MHDQRPQARADGTSRGGASAGGDAEPQRSRSDAAGGSALCAVPTEGPGDPPACWLQTSVGSLLTRCLSSEAHAHYLKLAREMDDERLENLDRHYSFDLGRPGTTVDMQLHSIVRYEMAVRRERRLAQLRRSLWLSSHRGRCLEAAKRWLI